MGGACCLGGPWDITSVAAHQTAHGSELHSSYGLVSSKLSGTHRCIGTPHQTSLHVLLCNLSKPIHYPTRPLTPIHAHPCPSCRTPPYPPLAFNNPPRTSITPDSLPCFPWSSISLNAPATPLRAPPSPSMPPLLSLCAVPAEVAEWAESLVPTDKKRWWLAHGWLVDDIVHTRRPGEAAEEVRAARACACLMSAQRRGRAQPRTPTLACTCAHACKQARWQSHPAARRCSKLQGQRCGRRPPGNVAGFLGNVAGFLGNVAGFLEGPSSYNAPAPSCHIAPLPACYVQGHVGALQGLPLSHSCSGPPSHAPCNEPLIRDSPSRQPLQIYLSDIQAYLPDIPSRSLY